MKKDLKIVLIISLIIVLGFAIFILWRSNLFTKNKIHSKTIIELYGSKEKLDKYIEDSFMGLYSLCSSGEKFDFTNKEQISFKDLSKENIYHLAYNYLNNNKKVTIVYNIEGDIKGNLISFSINDFEEAIKILFGKDASSNYKLEDSIIIKDGQIQKDHGTYQGIVPGNACLDSRWKSFYKYNSELNKDKYYVDVVLYYLRYSNEQDSNEKWQLFKYAFSDEKSEKPICNEENITKNLDKFTKYRFVFTKENDHVIFDHIELIK